MQASVTMKVKFTDEIQNAALTHTVLAAAELWKGILFGRPVLGVNIIKDAHER